MKKTVYDFDLAVRHLDDYSLGGMIDALKTAAISLANAALSSDSTERYDIVLQAQSAIFTATEFLDSIIEREVEQ